MVKDNWLHSCDYFNLTVDEFIETIDHAIDKGYSLAIDMHMNAELYNKPVNYLYFMS